VSIEPKTPADLEQYGVMGMKWGRRRPRGANGRVVDGPGMRNPKLSGSKKPKNPSRPSNAAHIMTDEELRARLNRLQMEKQYLDLTKPAPRQRKPAEKFIVDVLSTSGKSVATKYATQILSEAVAAGLRKSSNPVLRAAGGTAKVVKDAKKKKK